MLARVPDPGSPAYSQWMSKSCPPPRGGLGLVIWPRRGDYSRRSSRRRNGTGTRSSPPWKSKQRSSMPGRASHEMNARHRFSRAESYQERQQPRSPRAVKHKPTSEPSPGHRLCDFPSTVGRAIALFTAFLQGSLVHKNFQNKTARTPWWSQY